MEPENQQAPPVVAVIVVHEPGPWFDQTLHAFAQQDYPNLRMLFLTTQPDDALKARIRSTFPKAFVRSVNSNPGFGPTANEVMRLVDGDNGFFLICHDDVAPEPNAVRILVEEIYRSNAGVVGPKLVEWDQPGVLQTVGLGLDRFGEFDQPIESGELDQEQHDGVRDVFVVPSACMLVRADLFRLMDGFDSTISFYGDDVEFCWRVHHSGARVVVVPSARVRHRRELDVRRPDLNHPALAARHRMRGVATLTGAGRLPGRSLELVLLTVIEMIVGTFTGRFGQAWASLRALVGLIPRSASILARRRAIASVRKVPEREVLGLQVGGSARLSGFLRTRETSTFVGADANVRRWRGSSTGPVVAWLAVLGLLFVGSRRFFVDGIPPVGEFLAFPESPRALISSYMSSWNRSGSGSTSANPTGWATIGGLSVVTLFRMGMLHTLFVLGLVVAGLVGTWKLATVFPSNRARIGALVVYAASPLVAGALSAGRLTTLVAYASVPWVVHTVRRAVGVETADPRTADSDLADGLVDLDWQEQLRRLAGAILVVGLAAAFAPVMVAVTVVLAILLALGTLLAMAPWSTALRYLALGLGAALGGTLLNFPWFTTWTWDQMVGAPPIGHPGRGLLEVASFEIGAIDFASLSLVLYLPVVAAIALGRAWRLTWAVRAGVIVVAFGALAVLADRDALPFRGPEAGVLLVPVALGVAIAGAVALSAFDLDVRGGSFGWRQPLGLAANVAVVIGSFPGVAALGDGAWKTPDTQLAAQIDQQLPEVVAGTPQNEPGTTARTSPADYTVLLIGDARLLPVPGIEYRDGVSFVLIDDGPLDIRDRWQAPDNDMHEAISAAFDEMTASSTLRAGRLLAPLGIRYIIAPEFDNVISTIDDPLPTPAGLTQVLEDQLDLVSVPGFPTLDVFENSAWMPAFGQLTGDSATASVEGGARALVTGVLEATPVFVGADPAEVASDIVGPGVIHLAVPFEDNWSLNVDGDELEPRRAFGVTTAFDVDRAGSATLAYQTESSRSLLLLLQVALWFIVLFAATRMNLSLSRRGSFDVADETLIDLDGPEFDVGTRHNAVADPGLDVTSPGIERPGDPDAETNIGGPSTGEVSS